MPIDMEQCIRLAREQRWNYNKEDTGKNYFRELFENQGNQNGYSTFDTYPMFMEHQGVVISLHRNYSAAQPHPKYPHNHNFFEMSYVYSGEFCNIIEGTEMIQEKDTISLLSPRALHNPYVRDENSVVFNFLIKSSLVETIFIQMLEKDDVFCRFFLDAVYNINQYKPYMLFECTPELTNDIQEVIWEYFAQETHYETILIAKMVILFSKFSRSVNCLVEKEKKYSCKSVDIDAVMQYIQNNYAEVSLGRVADYFNYSPAFISRLIKKHTGKSFSDILSELRLEKASLYLTNSHFNAEQISTLVGYGDVSYFYKIFKRKYHCSPSEFRQHNQR